MTTTFLDVSGKTLESTSEPLDFLCTTTPIAISVGFGSTRPEERVYRDGAFLPGYRRSTEKAGVFSVVRDQEWPANPQLYVDEPTPIPATFWTTLYDKDLRTLPNQTVSATIVSSYLDFTADGQPWSFHGSGGSLMIVNGQGMVSSVNADRSGGNYYGGLHVNLKIYQMAAYDPAKETAVQVRFAGNSAAILGASVWATGSEQWGYGPGDENTLLRWYGTYSEYQGLTMTQVSSLESPSIEIPKIVLAASQLPWVANSSPVGQRNYRAGFFKRGATLDVWPSMESMTPGGGSTMRGDINCSKLKMGWYGGSASGNKSITATHIRVLQRAVA